MTFKQPSPLDSTAAVLDRLIKHAEFVQQQYETGAAENPVIGRELIHEAKDLLAVLGEQLAKEGG